MHLHSADNSISMRSYRRWWKAAVSQQSLPGLSGSCRGNTGNSRGLHSEAQTVVSRSPWTWAAPRWPAYGHAEVAHQMDAECLISQGSLPALPRRIWGSVDRSKVVLVDLWAPDDLRYSVDGLKTVAGSGSTASCEPSQSTATDVELRLPQWGCRQALQWPWGWCRAAAADHTDT